jgi:Amt family ammonium transporter
MTMSKGFRYGLAGLAAAAVLCAGPAFAQEAEAAAEAASTAPSGDVQYILNTLLFLIGGFLVMWMAAGFAMLEAGLVRSKNVSMQSLKNISSIRSPASCTGWSATS